MFESFSDRARSTVVRAQDHARRLGHHHLGTEHFLLALLDEPDGLTAGVLGPMGIRGAAVETEVIEIVGFGTGAQAHHLPFTPRARTALQHAPREARLLGHDTVEPEHILLAIIRRRDGVAMQILLHAGITPDAVRERVIAELADFAPSSRRGTSPAWTRAAGSILATAAQIANGKPLGSQHLVAALFTNPSSMAAQALAALGIDRAAVDAALSQLRVEDTSDAVAD
jgi:ATP-dependent Clp protease ATP-binding subunit ClpC